MTDISAKTVSSAAGFWRDNGYGNLADLLLALRAAIDAAEARERQAVEAERERCAAIVEQSSGHKVKLASTMRAGEFVTIDLTPIAAAIRTGAKP